MTSKPHRSACHRHPSVPLTGFCAYCLRERLAGIDSNASPPSPDLRRSKSCSGTGNAEAPSEPRRHSCEVRERSTLSDLFTLDDRRRLRRNRKPAPEPENSGFETVEEIRVCNGSEEVFEETKTMKEFIDLELESRKNAGRDSRSFWDAAGERFKKWKWKHKLKKNRNGNEDRRSVGSTGIEVEKRKARGLRETQSEVGEYGLGRRSCDTDPRLSIDAGRISLDLPRTSWDGCLIGKACSRLSPMVSLVEDANDNNNVGLEGVGECSSSSVCGYSESLSRRSFDVESSSSHRRGSMPEVDELKVMSNAKVSPATTELFNGAKLLIAEKDLRDSSVKSSSDVVVQSDCVLESASKDASTGVRKKGFKKLHKWRVVWNKLGLVHRREDNLGGEEECVAGDMGNKPIAESWQKMKRVISVQASEPVSQKFIRSRSVSCRNPCRMNGLVNGLSASETKGNVLNGRQEFTLQRNRSVRYSPSSVETGLLRFYLTPLRSYRRSKSGNGKSGIRDLHPNARSVL